MKTCNHLEGVQHDCQYVDWRDRFVEVAAAVADARIGAEAPKKAKDRAAWAVRWDAEYHREMRRLTADPFIRARDGQDAFAAVPEQFRDAMEELEEEGCVIMAGMSAAARGIKATS